MCAWAKDIGIDLGTASVLVYVKGKGVVLNEPSVVAIDKNTGKLLKVGADAQAMLGRTPGNIVAIRPLREGVISDYDMTERMLKEFMRKISGGSSFFFTETTLASDQNCSFGQSLLYYFLQRLSFAFIEEYGILKCCHFL